MSDEMLDLLEEGKSFAEQSFETEGHVPASAIVQTGTEAMLLSMDPSEGPVTKQEFRRAIQEAVRETQAKGVCIIAEIWYDTLPAHAATPESITDKPTRREGLLVCVEDTSGKTMCVLSPIVREDKTNSIGEWKLLGNVEVGGVFTGFFKAPKRPAFIN